MQKRVLNQVFGVVLMAVGLLTAGCAEQNPMGQEANGMARTDMPIQDVKNLPKWVTQRGAAFSGEKRVFYGVGNAAGLQNPSLRRRAAEGQARRDIAQTMQTYVAALQKQYQAETTAGDMSKQSVEQHITDTMKQVTDATLVGSQIVEYWEHPTRNEAYALARLDLEQFLDVMKSYQSAVGNAKELDAKVREYVRKNAEKAYDELNQELTKKSGGSAAVTPAPTSRKSAGRNVLATGDLMPVANGEIQASSAIEAGAVEPGALVTIAYEDLVAIVGGQDLAHLAGESVEIGAHDLVEIAYEDLVGLANADTLQVGSVVIEGAKGASSKSGGAGALAKRGKTATYVWVNKAKTVEVGFWENLRRDLSSAREKQRRTIVGVAAVRG